MIYWMSFYGRHPGWRRSSEGGAVLQIPDIDWTSFSWAGEGWRVSAKRATLPYFVVSCSTGEA